MIRRAPSYCCVVSVDKDRHSCSEKCVPEIDKVCRDKDFQNLNGKELVSGALLLIGCRLLVRFDAALVRHQLDIDNYLNVTVWAINDLLDENFRDVCEEFSGMLDSKVRSSTTPLDNSLNYRSFLECATLKVWLPYSTPKK